MILARDAALGGRGRRRRSACWPGCRPRSLAGGADGRSARCCSSRWVAVSGRMGDVHRRSTWTQWRWVLLTGLLLTGYVATWYAALARAQADRRHRGARLRRRVTALLSPEPSTARRRAAPASRWSRPARARRASLALRRRPPEAGCDVTRRRGRAPLRALRVSAERARPLRRRQSAARCSSTATPGSPTAASRSSRARSTAPGRTSS